ncbi:DNA mismatch repair protein MutS [Adhaeribacter arboris]|uniref:DNA mismatch repair protein MutS n=1 Tax=Adhaeribacter arboris TaxID=2072846 RepID=A0A2T2YFQ6_9BACT|nr:MutS family DNA mismatch repair protein [Adhaeribacter arboris]PSR54356.1 DNA mismatch repair protein MutS [Adhaeribacter arboris]
MIQPLPPEIFKNLAEENRKQELLYKNKCSQVGWLRLTLFIAGVSTVIYLFRQDLNSAAWVSLLLFYIVFIVVMRWHQRLRYTQHHHSFLKRINNEETDRLQGKLLAFDAGERYANPQHLYTSDLDIFGKHSLFQLLIRAVTFIGKDKLANWLQTPAKAEVILERQAAVAELAPQLSWRQELQAKAMHYKQDRQDSSSFFEWLHAPDFYRNKLWLKILIFVLPALTFGTVIAWWLDEISGYFVIGLMLVQYVLNIRYALFREQYYEQSSGMYEILKSYTVLLTHIETHSFQAKKLVELQQQLRIKQKTASEYFNELASIIEYISARLNVYMNLLLNSTLMWDYFWMYRLEKWKKTMATNLEPVLQVVAETETLASLAAFQYANPSYTLPELSPQAFEVQAEELGHPLIFVVNRVTNNLSMAGPGQTLIITGSNMSGKSTFLRTVAINLVLAFAGSAVCARRFRAFPAQVYTAMRTEDNLAESTSSFYAELKRLKMLIDLTATGTAIYYFLDEILKGTNSRDRHLGAQALIRQLHQQNASGLVSTHDLELGNMEEENPDYIQNYSFNSTIEEDKILFDYKLHPGVCNSFNASKLMQQMGIQME